MNRKFMAAVQQREGVSHVKLAGVIDEDNELAETAARLGNGTVIIDTSEVERINSCGVRDWVNWLTAVERNASQTVLVECSPAIVAQINLVNNFAGTAHVRSFYAPYYCQACELEKLLLVETSDLAPAAKVRAPGCRCDECDGVMELDDMEESYFAFLQGTGQARHAPNPRVEAMLTELTPSDPGDRKIRARVSTSPVAGAGASSSASLPGVPSLPPMPGGGTPVPRFDGSGSQNRLLPAGGGFSFPTGTGTGSGSGLGSGFGFGQGSASDPGVSGGGDVGRFGAGVMTRSGRSTLLVVSILVVAFVLLVYAAFAGQREPEPQGPRQRGGVPGTAAPAP